MTVDDVRREREAREARANERAAKLAPLEDYFASDRFVAIHTPEKGIVNVVECESHSDAVMVIVSPYRAVPDAYIRTGEMEDCMACNGTGLEYDETCVTCGGFGWVRA